MTPTKHTLEQILQIMTELWSWLADNPECESKRYWPGWNKYAEMTSDCPCCQYVVNISDKLNCEYCPLLEFWSTEYKGVPCVEDSSPFLAWRDGYLDVERSVAARSIAYESARRLGMLRGWNYGVKTINE